VLSVEYTSHPSFSDKENPGRVAYTTVLATSQSDEEAIDINHSWQHGKKVCQGNSTLKNIPVWS
jgi:hypothetical protein